jgi:hypothetical protein
MMTAAADFYIYLLSRPGGPELYVGKGKGNRWERHGGRGRHPNRHLRNVIAKCKREGLEIERVKLAENLTEECAFELEKFFIKAIGREDLGMGPLVNLTDGGDGPSGYKMPPELRAHHSAVRTGVKHMPEHNAAISAALTGRPKTPEHAAAAGAGQRGKSKKSGWWSTEEGRAKQRANNPGHTGKKHTPEARGKIKAKRALQTNVSTIATQFKPGNTAWKGRKDLQPAIEIEEAHNVG